MSRVARKIATRRLTQWLSGMSCSMDRAWLLEQLRAHGSWVSMRELLSMGRARDLTAHQMRHDLAALRRAGEIERRGGKTWATKVEWRATPEVEP